ncbi:putative alanine racemase [Chlamydiales bacterium STE3]|nr:putative alanine racemase [Chlamydiales bacterium STE3]
MDPFDLRVWPGFIQAGGNPTQPAIVDQIVTDSRRITSPNALFTALPGSHSNGHQFLAQAARAGACYVLVDRNWQQIDIPSITFLKVADPLLAMQEIAAEYRKTLRCKVVAIAGAFGKTMVKDLLFALLSTSKAAAASPESFNSQIGVALSLFTFSKKDEIVVVEAGISEKGEMQRLATMIQPNYGLITHLGKKHLATLGNIETSAQEMLTLFSKDAAWIFLPNHPLFEIDLSPLAVHFWNAFDPSLPHARLIPNQKEPFYEITFPDGSLFKERINGGYAYFIDLVNMAMKTAWKLGISKENLCNLLQNYIIEPSKTEIWSSQQQITFINHSYSSDPQSIDQALKLIDTSKGRKCFLFGGFKGQKPLSDYMRVAQKLSQCNLDILCLYGQHPYDSLIKEMQRLSPSTILLKAASYLDALSSIKPLLKAKDTLLIKGSSKEKLELILEQFNESLLSNLCTVNLAAIESNILSARKKLPFKTRIMVMVKAAAYGTNPLRMAEVLSNCGIDILGVSYIDEAIELIQGGALQDIFVLSATPQEASKIVKWNLEVGVSDASFLNALNLHANLANKQVKVHLHIDTGMGRFGCRPEMALKLAKEIIGSSNLKLEGIMTHFASSECPDEDVFTLGQVEKFDAVIAELEQNNILVKWKHAANSGGALRFHLPQYNMVRMGLALYGLYSSEAVQKALDLKLAVSLTSRIVGINQCKKGETISYGRTYTVEKDFQTIAVIPIGYFDGLHRNYSGKSYVLIRGAKAPMVGRICMDFMMVDITDIPQATIGDNVLIFGEDEFGNFLSPEDLAIRGNSIMHELITCLGPRIQRIFIFEESKQYR